MTRRLIAAIVLWVPMAVCVAGQQVKLREAVYEYGPDSALAPLDKTFQMALLDLGWVPLVVSPTEITAEIRVRSQHYAKVRIRFGEGKAEFVLLESSNLDVQVCEYREGGKMYRGPCVHRNYYGWLENVMANLRVAHAKVAFIKSLSIAGAPAP